MATTAQLEKGLQTTHYKMAFNQLMMQAHMISGLTEEHASFCNMPIQSD